MSQSLIVSVSHVSMAQWKHLRNTLFTHDPLCTVRHVRGKRSSFVHGTLFSIHVSTPQHMQFASALFEKIPNIYIVGVSSHGKMYDPSYVSDICTSDMSVYSRLCMVLQPTLVSTLYANLALLPLTTDKISSSPQA